MRTENNEINELKNSISINRDQILHIKEKIRRNKDIMLVGKASNIALNLALVLSFIKKEYDMALISSGAAIINYLIIIVNNRKLTEHYEEIEELMRSNDYSKDKILEINEKKR